jgi:F0F1-type ATP synthase membrane subunit b/b'
MGDGDRSQARETAAAAGQQGQEVAAKAKAEASQVTDTAKDQAQQVKDEVASQARSLVDQAKHELRDQGRSQADQVANAVRRVGDQAEALAEGRIDEAGNVRDYARQAGDRMHQLADELGQRGIDGVLNDAQNFARRRPGAFLLGCAAAGFVTGRLIRGGAASSEDSNGPSGGASSATSTEIPTYAPPTA